MPASLSLAQQIALLEKKRAVLSGLMQLIISLEQLRAGLEAVLLLGGNAAALSAQEQRSLEVIRQRVSNLEDHALRLAVQQLDKQVSGELEQLITLSLSLADDLRLDMSQLSQLNQHANSFNRNARTLIAMRALLNQRGEVLPPLQFPLPKAEIAQRLQQFDNHEQQVRQQAVEHIEGMRTDISVMLANPACSEAQQQTFTALNQALSDNLQHIREGRSLTELPMPIDDFEVSGGTQKTPAPQPAAVEEAPAASAEIVTDTAPEDSPNAEISPPGLIRRIGRWLNSPWNQGWKSNDKPPQ